MGFHVGQGGGAADFGAAAGAALDGKVSLEEAGAVLHDPQAEAVAVRGERGDAAAVIEDAQGDLATVLGERDGDSPRATVAEGVGDGLLGDTVEVRGGLLIQGGSGPGTEDPTVGPKNLTGVGGQFTKGGLESTGFGPDGREST